jgi:hypothetical protein
MTCQTLVWLVLLELPALHFGRRMGQSSLLYIYNFIFSFHFETGSPNQGDSLDRNIDKENRSTKDFLILVSYRFKCSYNSSGQSSTFDYMK